jgi:methylated-DNA-[protein]-cysteine S-methyltransferase
MNKLKITPFQQKVYDLTKKIPRGKVSSYSAIAKKLKSSPRAVGQALRVNPFAPKVPCHRVVRADGSIGGFSGETIGKQVQKKIALLRKEGVNVYDGKVDCEITYF